MDRRGMGALEFRPPIKSANVGNIGLDMRDLVEAARQALKGDFAEDAHAQAALAQIIQVGTSAGGARAKAVIAWNPTTHEIRSGHGYDLDDFIAGLGGNDTIYGDAGNDRLRGGDGNDVIYGGAGDDALEGGAGIDTLNYSDGTAGVSLNLSIVTSQNTNGAGSDTISGFENLTGTSNNDTLTGDAGNNVINGGSGWDTIQGGGGDDTLIGGSGTDTLTYANSASFVAVNLMVLTAQATYGAWNDTISGFENLTGSAFNDILTGDDNANTIVGGNGDDVLEGMGGSDILSGGNGIDTASYARATSAVTVNLSSTVSQNTIGAGTDTLAGIENLIGSGYNDTLTGNSGSNVIDGGAGNDLLKGGMGDDVYSWQANAGVDSVNDEGGADKIAIIGLSLENLTFSASSSSLVIGTTISPSDSLTLVSQLVVNSPTLIESMQFADGISIRLDSYNTWLVGTSAAENIYGDRTPGANDIILGRNGNDVLKGYNGNDSILGEGGIDKLYGGSGNDLVSGGSGNDLLYGEDGNDTLYGGAGTDTLTGGSGADRFVFDLSLSGSDTISDFNKNDDILDLSFLLPAFDPLANAITDFIQIADSGSNSVVKVDTDGIGTASTWTQVATLTGIVGLSDEQGLALSGHLIA